MKTGEEALEILEKWIDPFPQVVLIRAQLPDLSGLQVAAEIHKSGWPVGVLVYCLTKELDEVREMPNAEGWGCFLQDEEPPEKIAEAVRAVAAGEKWFSETILEMLLNRTNLEEGLTPRRVEIFRLVADGKSDKEIALMLGVRLRTVEPHLYRILKKRRKAHERQTKNLAASHCYRSVGRRYACHPGKPPSKASGEP